MHINIPNCHFAMCLAWYLVRSPLTTKAMSSLPVTTDDDGDSSIRQATSNNLLQKQPATTKGGNQKQDEQPSLTAYEMIASRKETESNVEEFAGSPNTTTGGDLPEHGHHLHRLPETISAKPLEDAVNVVVSGGDGCGRDGGGSGTRVCPSTRPMAAGDCDKVDAAQRPSTVKVTRTFTSRSGAANGDGARSAHHAAYSKPLPPSAAPTTPATALQTKSLDAIVASPSSESESRKRARGGGGMKAQDDRNQREDGPDLPARSHRGANGGRGGRQNRNTGHRGSVVVVDSMSGRGWGGWGGSVSQGGRQGTAEMNGAEVFESDPRSDVGQNKRVARWDDEEEGDAYSTIVWYKTIVACLMAAAS